MIFSSQSKILAHLVLSFSLSFSIVNASDIEEEKSPLKKLIDTFGNLSSEKKAPSLRKIDVFSIWQETFKKAMQEATEKYGYLKILREESVKPYFEKIEESDTYLATTAGYLRTAQFKELDIWTEPKVDSEFASSAEIFILLNKCHEETSLYLPEKHKSLSQKYIEFAKYEETDQLKKLKELFETINPLMTKFFSEPLLYQNFDALKEITDHILVAQQLIDGISKGKLKKKKGSNPVSASSSPKGSQKSEETITRKLKEKPRSKSFSGKSSQSKIDPIYKKLADEAKGKAQSVSKESEKK